MAERLAQRLAMVKLELHNRVDPLPLKLTEICEELLELIEQNRNDLTEAYEAQVRVDQRLHALEKVASTYHQPRG